MKRYVFLLPVLCLILFGFQSTEPELRAVNKNFSKNESLEYKVKYGIISAGIAKVEISSNLYSVNQRPCYKVDVSGRTTGAFDMVAKINDSWGSYIDTAALIPHVSYRKLSEGGYKKYEIVRYDHKTSFLESKTYNFKKNEFREPKYYMFPENVQDMISGFYYLRSIDFDTIAENDTIVFDAFFEDRVYNFKIIYLGKEAIETEFGKIKSFILKPVMPDNKVFAGENSITCWISDDQNKIPLKIKTALFIGSAEVDLVKVENLKAPLETIKEG